MIFWGFKVDWISLLASGGVSLLSITYFGLGSRWAMKGIVRLSVQAPKTSKFKELQNRPLKFIERPFPKNSVELTEVVNKINKDPNLKYSGVNNDIVLIIQCLFDDREELLVNTMDNIVISKQGIEILIFKIEKSSTDESYDRSILIDIASYKGILFQFQVWFGIALTLITTVLASSECARGAVTN